MKVKEMHCKCGYKIKVKDENIEMHETEKILDFLYDELGEGVKCPVCGATNFTVIVGGSKNENRTDSM